MFYAKEDGSVVLYRLRGDPKACYEDMTALTGQCCKAVEACVWRSNLLDTVVETSTDPAFRAA
jgi:hypothetical protein